MRKSVGRKFIFGLLESSDNVSRYLLRKRDLIRGNPSKRVERQSCLKREREAVEGYSVINLNNRISNHK